MGAAYSEQAEARDAQDAGGHVLGDLQGQGLVRNDQHGGEGAGHCKQVTMDWSRVVSDACEVRMELRKDEG